MLVVVLFPEVAHGATPVMVTGGFLLDEKEGGGCVCVAHGATPVTVKGGLMGRLVPTDDDDDDDEEDMGGSDNDDDDDDDGPLAQGAIPVTPNGGCCC